MARISHGQFLLEENIGEDALETIKLHNNNNLPKIKTKKPHSNEQGLKGEQTSA